MFEKIDNFAMQWLETAKSGLTPISEAMQAAAEFVFNLFWAIIALLIMVFTFPFWLLGKVRAQQSVHADAGDSAVSRGSLQASAESTSQGDAAPTQRG